MPFFKKVKVQNCDKSCISCGLEKAIRNDHKSGHKLACTAEEVEFLRKTDNQIPSLCYIHSTCRKALNIKIQFPNRCSICGAFRYKKKEFDDFGAAEEIKIHCHPNCLISAKEKVHSERWKMNVLENNRRKKLIQLDTVDADYREGRKLDKLNMN